MKRRTRTLTALAAVISITAAVLVVGPGYDTSQVRLLSGMAWLTSVANSGVTLVDGASAENAGWVSVAEEGSSLSVAQRGADAFVLDQKDGKLSRISGATQRVFAEALVLPGGPGLALVPARQQIYGLDVHSGMVSSVDPDNLSPREEPRRLSTSIRPGSAVVDGRDRLWGIDDKTGDVVWLTESGPRTRTVPAGSGHLTVTRGVPVLVDPTRGTAELLSLETGTVTRSVPTDLRAGDSVAISGSDVDSKVFIATGSRGELITCSFDTGSCSDPVRVGSPGAELGTPVEVGGYAVVPDYSTGEATIVDLGTSRVTAVSRLFDRPLRFELVTRDGIVFFNDPSSAGAGVLDLTGGVRKIIKYDEGPSDGRTPPEPDPREQDDRAKKADHQKKKPGADVRGNTGRTPQQDQPPHEPTIVVSPGNRGTVGDEFELTMVLPQAGTATTRWSFGDGTEAEGASVRHRWREQGAFTVHATTDFGTGTVTQAQTTVTVDPPEAPLEIIRLDVQRPRPVVSEPVHFSSESTGGPERWGWTVTRAGQSMPEVTARTAEFVHTFTTPGRYSVSLTVTRGSQTARSSSQVTVTLGAVQGWGERTVYDPDPLEFPSEVSSGVIAVDAGIHHALALKHDGSVHAWGLNEDGQASVPPEASSGVIAIAAGHYHNLALKSDGSVIAWGGENVAGERDVPEDATRGVVAIAAGSSLSLALKDDGSVIAWGYNWDGRATVPEAAKHGVIAIAGGYQHSMAVKADGTVITWGMSCGMNTPVHNATAVSAGLTTCVTLLRNGSVIQTQTLDEGPWEPPPTAAKDVVAIDTSSRTCLALKSDGSVIGWGYNSSGQATVPPEYDHGVLAVAAGANFSLVLVDGID